MSGLEYHYFTARITVNSPRQVIQVVPIKLNLEILGGRRHSLYTISYISLWSLESSLPL